MTTAAVLFVSHGAPTFALEPGAAGARLRELGAALAGRIAAVLVLSPHWQTAQLRITAAAAPATIHDFGGFDPALYRLRYPAPGSPALAAAVRDLLAAAGHAAALDAQRGFDHGAWVPLMHLLPAADVPVLQLSMPLDLDARGAHALGRALAPLRERGVLILGSGSLTHNLYELRAPDAEGAEYARAFAAWAGRAVLAGDDETLLDYRRRAPEAERAHPTEEHYLGLPFALGARAPGEPAVRIDGGFSYGVLSMDSYAWGIDVPPAAAMSSAAP